MCAARSLKLSGTKYTLSILAGMKQYSLRNNIVHTHTHTALMCSLVCTLWAKWVTLHLSELVGVFDWSYSTKTQISMHCSRSHGTSGHSALSGRAPSPNTDIVGHRMALGWVRFVRHGNTASLVIGAGLCCSSCYGGSLRRCRRQHNWPVLHSVGSATALSFVLNCASPMTCMLNTRLIQARRDKRQDFYIRLFFYPL